jgi:cytochrome c-type biogenesis protein CcmH/NrfG
METKFLVGIAAMAVATVVVLFGGLLNGSKASGRADAAAPETAAGRLLAGLSPGDTAAYAAQLEGRVAADPADVQSLVLLGLAYQQRARETGDPSFYPRSGAALSRAARLDPKNSLAATGLAALAASLPRFEQSRGQA